jgi:hypothetical protein
MPEMLRLEKYAGVVLIEHPSSKSLIQGSR